MRLGFANTMNEGEERDPYVSIRDRSSNYDVTNASDLRNMFFDPSRRINKGGFVTIVYVEEAAVNKTFRNGGFVDDNGMSHSSQDIEKQGRELGKDYINSFFDSDDYRNKLTKKRGASRPFAVFTTVTQQLNWNSMNYGKGKEEIDNVFKNASDSELDDFVAKDPDFAKRIAKFKEMNPDMADEIDQYVSMGAFPRDIIGKIRRTKLSSRGGGWSSVDGNDYVTRHEDTGNEALRLTKNSRLRKQYQSYVILADGQVKRISDNEFFYLQRAFGGARKVASDCDVQTSIRQAIDAINSKYEFRDYLIPQIAKMNFTIDGKPVSYCNHQMNIGGITIDADDFLNAPLSENKGKARNRYKIGKSDLRRLVEDVVNEAWYNNKDDFYRGVGKTVTAGTLGAAALAGGAYCLDKGLENQERYEQQLNKNAAENLWGSQDHYERWCKERGLDPKDERTSYAFEDYIGDGIDESKTRYATHRHIVENVVRRTLLKIFR